MPRLDCLRERVTQAYEAENYFLHAMHYHPFVPRAEEKHQFYPGDTPPGGMGTTRAEVREESWLCGTGGEIAKALEAACLLRQTRTTAHRETTVWPNHPHFHSFERCQY